MTEILFHTIEWFLRSKKEMELQESWEQDIKDFIYDWFKMWEFMVFYEDENWKEEEDSLIWKIDFKK